VDLRIDAAYVPDMNQRLMIYRKVAAARSDSELDQILAELRDRYGPLPEAVEHLEQYGRIRILADRLGVETIDREGQAVLIKLRPDAKGQRLNLERLIQVIGARGDARLLPPASIKLDLKAGATGATGARGAAGARGASTKPAPAAPKPLGGGGPSWWTARATAGEVKAGFTKEEILKPPKEDPSAAGGVFARVKSLLSELGVQ
jgi:transcription-repair coupling factor (superfamily II helicase)